MRMRSSARSLERLRALRLLARCPDGCTEALMMAYGFSVDFLAGLATDGLITAEPRAMRAAGRPMSMVWIRITDAGREVVSG
jgi:hypothetical protein